MNSLQPVKHADDLESFLFVLIYYAVRYLDSTLDDDYQVASFIDQSFDCYSVYRNRIIVGQQKATLIRSGKLVHNFFGNVDVSFRNPPLDSLINHLLSSFKDYYSEAKLFPGLHSTPAVAVLERPSSPTPPPKKIARFLEATASSIRRYLTNGGSLQGGTGDKAPQSSSDNAAQSQVWRRKIVIPSHRGMIKRFLEAINHPSWVSQPSVGDRVQSANYTSNVILLHMVGAETVRPGAKLPPSARKELDKLVKDDRNGPSS